jgi:hypothetical protein
MVNILIGLTVAAIVIAFAGLIVGTVALAFVIGVKNSTHTVSWKEAPTMADPFAAEQAESEPEVLENVNKRYKKFSNDELKPQPETDLVDLDSPEVVSNFN